MKLTKILFFSLMLFFVFQSCSKDEDVVKPTNSATLPEIRGNVKIIDATKLQLDLTQSQIDNGVYKFTFTGIAPTIVTSDVIVGEQGEGFIRKVITSTINGSNIVLQTTQGRMSDVFKTGGFNFNLDMSDMHAKKNTSGFSYTITNQTVYQQGALGIVLNSGQVDFQPNWFLDFNFSDSGINNFEISAKNGNLNGNFTATVTASQAVTLINKSSSILANAKPFKKSYTKWVPATLFGLPVLVPVTVEMQLDLVLDYSANISAAITRQANFASNNTFNLGLNYSNGQWNDINSFTPINNFTLSNRTGNAIATINLALTPKVSFKLYGQAGPYASVSLMEQLSGSIASPSLDWDFKADVWLKSTVGASVSIMDYNLADYSKSWETSKLTYSTPNKIEKISGDLQTGTSGQQLANTIKVKVVDNLGNAQSNVPVYFSVVNGGSVSSTTVISDSNGFAETNWTLGTNQIQNVNVSVKKPNGSNISNSPISFTATVSNNPLDGIWKMDFTLAPLDQDCDENLLEDEAGIPPTFHFNPNGTLTFDSCSIEDVSNLNNPAFYTNTYTFENNILKIKSRYVESSNGVEYIFITEATLTYESNTKSFDGSHTFKSWENGVIFYNCANTIKIYK
jgi:hypothetical protein